jgi:hypothetical protein
MKLLKEFKALVSEESNKIYFSEMEISIDELYSNGLKYIAAIPRDPEIHIGDKIKVVKRLGSIIGKAEDKYFSKFTGDTQIGSVYVIVKISENREMYYTSLSSSSLRFIRKEIQKEGEDELILEFRKYLDEVYKLMKNDK